MLRGRGGPLAAVLLGLSAASAAHAQSAAGRLRFTLPAPERATTILGFEGSRSGPALTATSDDPLIQLLVARAAHDTVLVRELVTDLSPRFDRLGARNAPPPVLLAEAELWAGDTAAARTRLDAFARRAAAMDGSVEWDGVANGAWLARVDRLRARVRAPVQAATLDTTTVPLRAAAPGTYRFRYDMALWTRLPVALPGFDSVAPTTRLALVVDETLDPAGVLSRAVAAVALDVPFFARLGDDGIAAQQGLVRALNAARSTRSIDRRMRPTGDDGPTEGDDRWTDVATSLLASLEPLGLAPALPLGAVRSGDTWTDTITVRVPGTVLESPLRLAVGIRLADVRQDDGRTVAVILRSARIRHAVFPDGSTVSLTLSAETVVDLGAGVPVRAAASLRALVRDARGATVPVRVLLTASRQVADGPGAGVAVAR